MNKETNMKPEFYVEKQRSNKNSCVEPFQFLMRFTYLYIQCCNEQDMALIGNMFVQMYRGYSDGSNIPGNFHCVAKMKLIQKGNMQLPCTFRFK